MNKNVDLYENPCEKYECPICCNYATKKIFRCRNKHMICEDCIRRQSRCPICRCYFGLRPTRMLELEQSAKLQQYTCTNDGCSKTMAFDEIEHHQSICPYRLVTCVLRPRRICNWTNIHSEISYHVVSKHGLEYGESPSKTITFYSNRLELMGFVLRKNNFNFVIHFEIDRKVEFLRFRTRCFAIDKILHCFSFYVHLKIEANGKVLAEKRLPIRNIRRKNNFIPDFQVDLYPRFQATFSVQKKTWAESLLL